MIKGNQGMRIILRYNLRKGLLLTFAAVLMLVCLTVRMNAYFYEHNQNGPLLVHLRENPRIEYDKRDSYFLQQFKNPCYLSGVEEKVLGPFHTERNGNEMNGDQHAVFVEMEGHQKETLRCLPYYFILGWPKCGTTELSTKIHHHPQILHAPLKEPAFFSSRRFDGHRSKYGFYLQHARDYVNFYDKNTREMALYYSKYGGQVPLIVGDHSTHTIDQWHGGIVNSSIHYTPGIPDSTQGATFTFSNPQLIKYIVPQSKFIVMFRDPVDRLYSLYKMHEATSPDDFHQGVVFAIDEWKSCLKRGTKLYDCLYTLRAKHPTTWGSKAVTAIPKSLYYYFIQEWLSIFPREHFLFIKFPEFTADPDGYINNKVFPFLGVHKLNAHDFERMKKSGKEHVVRKRPKSDGTQIDYLYDKPMLNRTRLMLIDFFKPYNKKLAASFNDEDFNWSHY